QGKFMAEPLIGHVEIPSTDLERSKDFYLKVFGWEFKPFGNGYLLFNNHKGIMVGLRQVDRVSIGDTTVFHVNIPDINSILEKVKSNGGAVKRTKTVIPAMGWYALFTDPDGNTIGLFQKG
ncbi:MAG: VOC family protein, partial [Ignavibacterium sp.]|nr:VOC family protein [Ignavibacterium sp.]